MTSARPGRARGTSGLWLVLMLFWLRASVAEAAPPALDALVARGAAKELTSGFALEGDAVAAADTFERAGCRGYLAWSLGRSSDVDLSIYSESGQLLSDDHGSAGYGYARLCAEAGFHVRVVAASYAGQGELRVLVLPDAPEAVDRYFVGTSLGVLAPGSAEGERDVGEPSFAMRADGSLPWGDDSALSHLGYSAAGEAQWVPLTLTGAEVELQLPASRCSRIEIEAPFQRGVVATVQLSTGELLVGQAPGREHVDITACVSSKTRARVRVRPRVPRGLVGVRAYVHALPVDPPALHAQHAHLARKLEMAFVARAHGLVLRHLEDVWLEPGGVATRPLPNLEPGCNAVMVLPDETLEVDVRWLSASGQLLALSEGRSGFPVLYRCGAADTGTLRVRARGRSGKVGLWVAEPEAP